MKTKNRIKNEKKTTTKRQKIKNRIERKKRRKVLK